MKRILYRTMLSALFVLCAGVAVIWAALAVTGAAQVVDGNSDAIAVLLLCGFMTPVSVLLARPFWYLLGEDEQKAKMERHIAQRQAEGWSLIGVQQVANENPD